MKKCASKSDVKKAIKKSESRDKKQDEKLMAKPKLKRAPYKRK